MVFRNLIGSSISKYPALFTFGQNNKMASSYVYVRKNFFFINKVAVPDSNKKATKLGNYVFKNMYFVYFLAINAIRMCFEMFCLQIISRLQADIP